VRGLLTDDLSDHRFSWRWLGGQIHTGMLFTLIGVFTGLVAGITSIVALYRATLRSSELEWRGESVRQGKTTRQ
jgi:hypothetical protein